MAEVNSKQAANKAANKRNRSADYNPVRCLVITTPDAWTAADGDTMATGQKLPPEARPIGVKVGCAAGAASSTVSVGHRKLSDGSGAVAASLGSQAINAAGTFDVDNGTLMANGADAVTPDYEVEVFLTFGGANPTANQDLRIEVLFVAP